MHRFRLILLPLCLFATATAIGQTVTGRIVDEQQQPVAGVAVVMQTPDSVYVDAVASDLEGRFAIASDVRPYRLLFQHLSYDPLTVERSGDDAGTVTLTEATNLVDEVVVRGERPLVKVEQGRLSYDLQVAAQGKIAANAYEALTKLPGVSERDGALTLAGAAGVTVILNGKPSTMTAEQLAALLKSTPVEQVEKVEVLYAAPPQYHIRGAAINVVLRRRFGRSFSGQVNGTYDDDDPIGVLDVTVLSNRVLDKLLDIKDLRTSKRIDFVGGIRGLGELRRRVDSGEMKVAFALYPVSMKQLIDIADTGNIMPPKTTWFEPKLRSGVVIHSFEEGK